MPTIGQVVDALRAVAPATSSILDAANKSEDRTDDSVREQHPRNRLQHHERRCHTDQRLEKHDDINRQRQSYPNAKENFDAWIIESVELSTQGPCVVSAGFLHNDSIPLLLRVRFQPTAVIRSEVR